MSAAATAPGLLDRFIPSPDVRERFETTIQAPPAIVTQVAVAFDMQSILVVRAIFRLRELLLGAKGQPPRTPQGILEEAQRLGWGILDEQPSRFVICGARCRPWMADVRFTAIAPQEFASYGEPDRVKIAWTLNDETVDAAGSGDMAVYRGTYAEDNGIEIDPRAISATPLARWQRVAKTASYTCTRLSASTSHRVSARRYSP